MNTLSEPKLVATLSSLHEKANEQSKPGVVIADNSARFMAVSPAQGEFLYWLATLKNARNIVEFGCSFGVSTIYLAAAAKDNGGLVTTTEMESAKWAPALNNINEAGLTDYVKLLKGDALETLKAIDQPIDFLFLDGAKQLYLPVFELLEPNFHSETIIFLDNTDKPDTIPCIDYIKSKADKFVSAELFEGRSIVVYVR